MKPLGLAALLVAPSLTLPLAAEDWPITDSAPRRISARRFAQSSAVFTGAGLPSGPR